MRHPRLILEARFSPDGFNIGANCGDAAGRSVWHAHIHMIPCYEGDIPQFARWRAACHSAERQLLSCHAHSARAVANHLVLGIWRGLYLYEHRHAGQARSLVMTVVGAG